MKVYTYEELLIHTMEITEFKLAVFHLGEEYHVVVIYPQTFGRPKFNSLIEFMEKNNPKFVKKLDAYSTSIAAVKVANELQNGFQEIIKKFYEEIGKDEILPYHTLMNLIIGTITKSYQEDKFYFPFIFTEALMGLEESNYKNTDYINAYGLISNTFLDIHMTQLKNPVITKKNSNLILNNMTKEEIETEIIQSLESKEITKAQQIIKDISKMLFNPVFIFICQSITGEASSSGLQDFLNIFETVATKYDIKASDLFSK